MKRTCIIIVAALLLASCSTNERQKAEQEEIVSMLSTPVSNMESPASSQLPQVPLYTAERKVIKEGEIAFASSDIPATEKFIKQTAWKYSGYIDAENLNDKGERKEYVIEVKIPAQNFETFLAAISDNAGKLDKKDIHTEDVTEDYIDTEARIKAMMTVEERYFELLKQAKNVKEMLKVENELTDVRRQIETAQGHLNYLSNNTSFSSLKIVFYPPTPVIAEVQPPTFANKFSNALQNGWEIILSLTLGLANIWPLIVLFVIIGSVLYSQKKKGRFA